MNMFLLIIKAFLLFHTSRMLIIWFTSSFIKRAENSQQFGKLLILKKQINNLIYILTYVLRILSNNVIT